MQQKEEADEVIARNISLKLGDAAGISYSEIANKAYECGRTELAIKVHAQHADTLTLPVFHTHSLFLSAFCFFSINLFFLSQLLEFEPRSGEQVPLLLRMKRSQLALSKAIESGDTDLGINTRTASNTLNAELMHYLYRFNTNILNTDTEEI